MLGYTPVRFTTAVELSLIIKRFTTRYIWQWASRSGHVPIVPTEYESG